MFHGFIAKYRKATDNIFTEKQGAKNFSFPFFVDLDSLIDTSESGQNLNAVNLNKRAKSNPIKNLQKNIIFYKAFLPYDC